MIQVEIFTGRTVQDLKNAMNQWFKDRPDAHVLSMLPMPTQQGMFLLMLYEDMLG